jgi:acyl-coenzyme A synthetase/AMP-(fatty) acid ligase
MCPYIGAVHSVVFAGCSAEALASRINDGIHSFNFTLFKLLKKNNIPLFVIS